MNMQANFKCLTPDMPLRYGIVGLAHNSRGLERFVAVHTWITSRLFVYLLIILSQLLWVIDASAQLPIPPSTQFDITGFLQEAVLDSACSTDSHCGGYLKVNGHTIVVPKETVVMFPANALTWQEVFAQAPAPYGLATSPPTSGMAMADFPLPLSSYEVHVIGNRVLGGPAGADLYIAGLVSIAQQGLNSGSGFINHMDYNSGEMRVGGVLGDPTTGARVRINDPVGRYGRVMSPDQRFTVDPDNPTIAAGTGFPMCFPRWDPASASGEDPDCPQGNRPPGQISIQMNSPVAQPGIFPDATKQAPFQVGDFVTFSGTLVTDDPNWPTTAGSNPGAATTYISAHTIGNNIAIYTWPGTNPAYVSTEVTIIGTGGLTVVGAGEAAIRTRFEGMTTDPSRKIHLYGIDVDPLTGQTADRDWGTIGVDQGPPLGAVKGRWRFRPPCLVFGSTSTKPDKECVAGQSGTFLPPTREMRAVIEGAWVPGQQTTYANGIIAGQYHAPIAEYIFPENIPGSPIVENNFNSMPFLAQGGYTSAGGTLVKQLNPWPSNIIPAQTPTNVAPVANAGPNITVASSANGIVLTGSATGTPAPTFLWTVPAGANAKSALNLASLTFDAPTGPATLVFTLTATNVAGSSTASVTVTVNAPVTAVLNPVAPQTVYSGTTVTLQATGSGISSYQWTEINVPAGFTPVVFNPLGGAAAKVTFPVSLPLGQVNSITRTFQVSGTTSGGTAVPPVTTTVTVVPLPDAITGVTSEYRTGKQRLSLAATSSVISPNVILKLQPYVTQTGTTFDPSTLGNSFTNNGNGLYTLDLVGAPPPACANPSGAYATPCSAAPLVIKSNLNGSSGPQALQKIRN